MWTQETPDLRECVDTGKLTHHINDTSHKYLCALQALPSSGLTQLCTTSVTPRLREHLSTLAFGLIMDLITIEMETVERAATHSSDHAPQHAVGCQLGAREWLVGLVGRVAPLRIRPAAKS